jgi:ribosomal protein S18 acetylase RimI-like enzyme
VQTGAAPIVARARTIHYDRSNNRPDPPMPLDRHPPAIRTLHPADWPVYRALRLRALADAPAAFCSTYAEESQRGDDAWAARLAAPALGAHQQGWPFAAELDGTPVGLAWVKLDAQDGASASLYQVWVAPEARGRGVGAALVEAAIAWARARRAHALQLQVTSGDGAAARLYRRLGFVDAGAPVPRPGSGLSEQAMVLTLGAQGVSDWLRVRGEM